MAKPNPRYAAVIMDAQTGKILHQAHAHKSLAPASLTKMMTLFMAFEALENGKLHMNKYLTISSHAINQPPSRLGLDTRTKITVKEAIYILITRSANDVAAALAETISGSEAEFAKAMTKRAHSLGMKNSYFYNASGLPHPKQKSTAYDMAVLGRALMQYFPQHYHFFKTVRYNYKGRVIETHNNLLRRFKGMDGMKTGYTHASGFNLVSSAVRDNRRVIVSVFGGRTAVRRDNHVADLMNRGFAALERDKTSTQFAKAPVRPASEAVAVTRTASAERSDSHVAVIEEKTTTTTTTMNNPSATASNRAPRDSGIYPVAAQQAAYYPNAYQEASYQPARLAANGNWGIQVGAFSSAIQGQRALQNVQSRLGYILGNGGQAVVVPMQTARGTIYRARIIGLSSQTASQACAQLDDCMAFVMR